ncbi:hypothetical protein MCOR22_003236 [Pyricularia oryzae]|nr:hypothetical protein MCOR22_003236 [Pyricularia oryzae]
MVHRGVAAIPAWEALMPGPADHHDIMDITMGNVLYSAFVGAILATTLVSAASTPKGCFKNPPKNQAALGTAYPQLNNAKMTVAMCEEYCTKYHSSVFALDRGRYCTCGDAVLPEAVAATSAQCKTKCGGDAGAICGATGYFNLYELDTSSYPSAGQWGPIVKFPVVPVSVALIPESGDLIVWSSGWPDRFTNGGNGKTYTSIYNVQTGNVSEAIIQNTSHDMFCPGTSMDEFGRIVVTGGSGAAKTSVFDFKNGQRSPWMPASDLTNPRGYQSSVTTSEGKIFTIGGTFSGNGKRDGEVYDVNANKWTKLPGCPATIMRVAGGLYPDSHTWLWGWKDGFVLQAGPSKKMNWFDTKGTGGNKPAGTRGADQDSMCGVTAMYDAAAGKVFTYGGGLRYTGESGSNAAHVLTLPDTPGDLVAVERVSDGQFGRGYHNAVVLPDGKVFVVGGMSRMALFSDGSPQLFPEIWDPATGGFTTMRPHTIPRNYHSTAMLMADGTVFSGGGGLCGAGCSANHFDGQFFSPPYLFQADGRTPAQRPVIRSLGPASGANGAVEVRAGDQVTVTMQDAGAYSFSMIRTGSTTHTVNTDSRRIPLAGQDVGGGSYVVTVPSDYGIATPGYYMLFALSEAGVPAVAKFFRVGL